jgi:hypothetical protein
MDRLDTGSGMQPLMRRSLSKISRSKISPSKISRAAMLAAGVAALGACSSAVPDFSQFKLPSTRQFLPSNSDTYVPPPSAKALRPVEPADLVDGQGACAGTAVAAAETAQSSDAGGAPAPAAAPAAPGPVSLSMTECEVVRALGQPQSLNLANNDRGERKVTMTFIGSERGGVYEFVSGRLVSLERGPEPPAPPKPEKPAKKKAAAKRQS